MNTSNGYMVFIEVILTLLGIAALYELAAYVSRRPPAVDYEMKEHVAKQEQPPTELFY